MKAQSFRIFAADTGMQWFGPGYVPRDCPHSLRVEVARDRILDDFVHPFVGFGVDALVLRIAQGNQFLCYDTEVGESVTAVGSILEREYGLTPRGAGGPEYVSFPHALGLWRLAENFRLLGEIGFDPWEAIIDRAHDREIQVFLDLQINPADPAGNYLDGSGMPASRFLLEHEEWLLGYDCHRVDTGVGAGSYRAVYDAPAPDGDSHARPETAFCPRLDFGRREVRDYRLAVIDEISRRYDLDGIQIDFCSDPHFFKQGETGEGRELLSGFMSRARQILKDNEQPGREARLLARLFAHRGLDYLRDQVGMDVAAWMADGSVDILVPVVSATTAEHAACVRECVEAAAGSNCQVLAGVSEVFSDQFTKVRPTTEMLQASNLTYRRAGVDGLQISWPRSQKSVLDYQRPDDFELLGELKDASTVERADKHYVWRDQLPLALPEGGAHLVGMTLGDDVEAGLRAGAVETVLLVIGLRHFTAGDEVSFFCNGREIPWDCFVKPDYPSIWYRVGRLEAVLTGGNWLRRGDNVLGVRVRRHVPDAEGMELPPDHPKRPDHLVLMNLELIVKYKRTARSHAVSAVGDR